MTLTRVVKIIFSVLLGIWAFFGAFNLERFWLLDGANILFHEAGHLFFSPFGQTLGICGGTLLQLLFPLGIMISFFVKRQPYSGSVMLWWFGQNGIGISKYIQDARVQVLNYIGGEIHDWHYLLSKMNLLKFDQEVGAVVWLLGLLTMLCASILAICFSKEK